MSWLFDFFKRLWNAIRKVLAVVLIVLAVILLVMVVFASGGLLAPIFGIVLTTTQAILLGVLAITGAFLIDPETASATVGAIGEAAGDAAEAVGSAVGDVVSGATEGVFSALSSSPIFWIALGIGAFWLFGKSGSSDDASDRRKVSPRDSTSTGSASVSVVASEGSNYGTVAI